MPLQSTRNAIFSALLAKLQTIQFPPTVGQPTLYSQRFIPWESCTQQPAVMLLEGAQKATEKVFGQKQWRMSAVVLVYYRTGPAMDGPIPAQQINDILDAFESALQGQPRTAGRQTLGGLVTHAYIDGTVAYDDGTTDQSYQAVLMVPITIVVA
jgi:hypothetical protein